MVPRALPSGEITYEMRSAMGIAVSLASYFFAITVSWSGLVALVAFFAARRLLGLRVHHDAERQGLDISSHGESAYEL